MRRIAAVLFTLALVPHALAAGRELAPRPLIPRSDFVVNLDVARAGDRFLTVWEARDGNVPALYGAISDAGGNRVSPAAFLVADTAPGGSVALDVVGTNDSFAVFWIDLAHAVHMTDVALDGTVLGTRTLELPSAQRVVAEWGGDRFLVALHRENQFRERGVAALLARDGTVIRGDILLHPTAAPSHIADTAFGFLVFSLGRDLFGHVVLLDGSSVQVATSDAGGSIVSARIGDGRQLVAYAMGDGQLRTAAWLAGNKLEEQTVTVESSTGVVPVGIVPGDGVHLLVYGIADSLYTVRLDDDGAPVSRPQPAASGLRRPRGASNGTVLFVPHLFAELFDEYVASVTFTRQPSVSARQTLSIRPARQSHVLVGAGGGSMVAVWDEATAGGATRIRSARIDRDFETAEVHEIAAEGALVARTLPWNGTEYLVLYRAGWQLFAARVGYDGERIGTPRPIAETDPVRAAATWAGDRWAVAWAFVDGSPLIQYATLSYSGVPSPPQSLELTGNLAFDVALAFDGNRVHLAWIETAGPYIIEPPPHGHAVFTTRLRRNGRVADATPLAIPVTSPRGVSLAGNGERIVLVVDEEPGTAAHAIDAKTRQLAATRTLHEGQATDSDVTWDGYDFVAAVSYLDPATFRRYLKVLHLGRDGTATGPPRVTETLARKDPHVSIASSPAYDAVAALQETDAVSGERAVIYPERELFRP